MIKDGLKLTVLKCRIPTMIELQQSRCVIMKE